MKQISMLLNAKDKRGKVKPEIYGHFAEHLGSCIYDGIYVGENSDIPNTAGVRNDVIEAFRQIKMPVLRWPGGCFADEYHWQNGIGDKAVRPRTVNNFWGGVIETNAFGTHEFFNMCEQIGCQPYLAGNLGSGSIKELADWLEYLTFDGDSSLACLRRKNGREKPWKLKYLGIGNENWGGGGNMRPEYYADEYRRYQNFCRNFSGDSLYKIACGPNADDYRWTEVLMQNINKWHASGISLHYYTVPSGSWEKKGSATSFTDEEYYKTVSSALYIEELIVRHGEIMSRYDKNGDISLIVDEWGCWYDVEEGTNPGFLYQQNTMRDAVTAACSLNIFNRHSHRVAMANLAQAVNVLQSLILTRGADMVKTPTYHVFDMFKGHQGGDNIYLYTENSLDGKDIKIPMINASATIKDGVITLTAANCSLYDSAELVCDISGIDVNSVSAQALTEEIHALNSFDNPERVKPQSLSASLSENRLKSVLPPASVASFVIR